MKKKKLTPNKILFLVPSFKSKGGISYYYSVIKDCISFPYEYFYRGVRKQHSRLNHFFSIFVFISDYIVFYLKIRTGKYPIVIINSSFNKTCFWRDLIFIKILQFYRNKYIVFFRGIDDQIVDNYVFTKRFMTFKNSFLRADKIIVLSKKLKQKLISHGYDGIITVETTLVDSSLLWNFNIDNIKEKQNQEHIKILFLSRIEKDKGIYELIESFKLVYNKYPNTSLHICGIGSEQNKIHGLIHNNHHIFLKGYVDNNVKKNEYLTSHIFVLPSYHEGMPNSIIEALAFGLPVITTPVGGIPDIFVDGVNGTLLKEINPKAIYDAIEHYIIDSELRLKIGINNYTYAKEKFYKEIVVDRLSRIIE